MTPLKPPRLSVAAAALAVCGLAHLALVHLVLAHPASAQQEGEKGGGVLALWAGEEWQGDPSAVAVDATMTARDQRAWDILWQMVGDPAPGILPDGQMAVAVFLAGRSGAARRVEISDIVAGETALVIGYHSQTVEEGGENGESGDSPGITAPYVVRLVPDSSLPVYYVGSAPVDSSK